MSVVNDELERILADGRDAAAELGASLEIDEAFVSRAVERVLDQLGPAGLDSGGSPSASPAAASTSAPPAGLGRSWRAWSVSGALLGTALLAAALVGGEASPPTTSPAPDPGVSEVTATESFAPTSRSLERRTPRTDGVEASSPTPPDPSIDTEADEAPEPTDPPELAPTMASAAELFRQANQARGDEAYRRAAALYRELLRTHPRSREATIARLSLGRLELDRFSRPRAALRQFDAYLRSKGDKPLAGEALVGRARAFEALGDDDEATQAWQRLLDEFPSSAHAQRARRRLQELERASP